MTDHYSVSNWQRDRLWSGVRALGGNAADSCGRCLVWQLRYLLAARATPHLAQYIGAPHLIDAVVDDLVGAWMRWVETGRPGGFEAFFAAYCSGVERLVRVPLDDPARRKEECQRVWMMHAVLLRGGSWGMNRRPDPPHTANDNQGPRNTEGERSAQSAGRAASHTRSNESR